MSELDGITVDGRLAKQRDHVRKVIQEARRGLDLQSRLLNLLEQVDLSAASRVGFGQSIHITVVGLANFRIVRKELGSLKVRPSRASTLEHGEYLHRYLVPQLDDVPFFVEIVPDLTQCHLVQVGEKVTPLYRAECE